MAGTRGKAKMDRKMSMQSVGMKTEYNVQHRSDLLMDQHVRNVRQAQFELQSALQELESAKSADEIESLREEVAELKPRAQKLVLALQVMDKINTELKFARADLNDSLHKGIGDINAARKRVIWLEDKMGELCGRKRLKTRRPSNRFVTDPTYGWDTDSEGEQRRLRPLDSAERMYASDQTRNHSITQLLGSEIGFTSDSEHMIQRQVGFQDVSSHSYDSQEMGSCMQQKGPVSSQEDVSAGDIHGLNRIQDHRKPLHDSINSLTSGGQAEILEESGSEKFSTVREASVVGQASPHQHDLSLEKEGQSQQTLDTPEQMSDQVETDDTAQVGSDLGHEDVSPKSTITRTPITIDTGREEYEDDEEKEEEEKEESEGDEEDAEEARGSYEEDEDREGEKMGEEKTFITEVEAKEEKDASVSQVAPVGELDENRKVEEPLHRDFGTEYWNSEHHRFEYSEFANVFTEVDPLSYHQVGLAVPGSFIKREDTDKEFTELPWRTRRKGSDIKDIHRVALDKLAARVHGIYDKVYNAAMMSVKPAQVVNEGRPRETSVFLSLENDRLIKPESSMSRSTAPPQTAPASLREKTEDKIGLPMEKEMRRGGTFVTKHLVFYPKPIPPPQVLPITRTSLNKEFPQFASSFSKPDPDARQPAERLVDQRNLLEETKLVLYKEKVKPATPGPTHLERKFRKMLERDRATSQKSSGKTEKSEKARREEQRKKIRHSFKTAGVMAKLQKGVSNWNQIKPQSRGKEYAGLRWERVKTIVHMNVQSPRTEERIDGCRQLGLLRCGDTMVFYALKERLHNDVEDRVRYEAAKSLILIGCWEDEVIQCVLKYLVLGNTEIRVDLINTLTEGKNAQYVDKTIPSFVELVKVLSHFCRNPDPEDLIAFNSAVCLGRLCVKDDSAKERLLQVVEQSSDTHLKAKALEILVKQLCIF